MNDNTKIPVTLDEAKWLIKEFDKIYDEDLKLRDGSVDSKEVQQFLAIINSPRIGISKDMPPKQIGIKIHGWYETLAKAQGFTEPTIAETPQGQTATTLTSDRLEELIEKDEATRAEVSEIEERQSKLVQDFKTRGEAIFAEQQKIQAEIKKSQELDSRFEGKSINVEVVYAGDPELNSEERVSLTTLQEYSSNTETRTDLINDLSTTIEEKVTGAENPQLIARTAAVEIVNTISNPTAQLQKETEVKILEEIEKDNNIIPRVLQNEKDLIEAAKKGAALQAIDINDSVYLPENVARNLFGNKLTDAIYMKNKLTVNFNEDQNENTTHQVSFDNLNSGYQISLSKKNAILENLREFGIDKTKSIVGNNVNNYLVRAAKNAPEGSLLKKAYSSQAVKGILANHGIGTPIEWQAYNRFGSTIINYFPDSAPYFKLFSEVTGVSVGIGVTSRVIPLTFGQGAPSVIKSIQPIKILKAPYTLGVTTGKQVAVNIGAKGAVSQAAVQTGTKVGLGGLIAKGATALGVSLGVFTAGISTVITAAIFAIGKLINWPKVKKWFRENKTLFGIGAGVGAMMVGGPVAGVVVGGLGLAATGGLRAAVFGTFLLFGFIGRNIGVQVAKAAIVTLVIIPPLVGIILLIINNSAYVVPPSLSNQSQDNLYIEVSKVGEPAGPFENEDLPITVNYTITVRAKKGPLTNISFDHTCKVIQEGGQGSCSSPEPEAPASISPTNPFVFTYEETYSGAAKYNDSLVLNIFKVTADSPESQGESTSGSETIIIGDPPTQCLEIDGDWGSYRSNIEAAVGYLTAEQPNFVAKVCAQFPDGLPLRFNGGGYLNYWGWWRGDHLLFYPLGVKNDNDAIYTLSHELVHALVDDLRQISIYLNYLAQPGIILEVPRCFYSYETLDFEERLADATAFAIMPTRYCSMTGQDSNINHWPLHKTFIENNILK